MKAQAHETCVELFKSITDRGTRWLFIIQREGEWAITRNGERVAGGASDRASLKAGVEQFMALTHLGGCREPCDVVAQRHLNCIEGARIERRTGVER